MDESYLSIDISLPNCQFDFENARENLRHLQTHIQSKFVHGMNRPIVGTSMACQGSGSTHFINRHDSVPEEALFGNGPDVNDGNSIDTACSSQTLPNFDLIIGSTGSSDHDDKSPRNTHEDTKSRSISAKEKRKIFRLSSSNTDEVFEEVKESMNNKENVLGEARTTLYNVTGALGSISLNDDDNLSGQCNDVVSANEKHFSTESTKDKVDDIEAKINDTEHVANVEQCAIEDVFENVNNEAKRSCTLRSNSLPDVILSSSSSGNSSSSFRRHADSPDVTASGDGKHYDEIDILQKRKEVRDIIEGPTCSSFGEISKQESLVKKKLSRAVSFSEFTERRIIGDEKDITEMLPLKDEPVVRERNSLPSTPSTPDEKRFRYSQSSGYVTGSDKGSQEGTSEKGSMESSHPWSSAETNNGSSVEFSEHILQQLIQGNKSQKTEQSDKVLESNDESYCGSDSNISVHTVINSGASTTETSVDSSMHTSGVTKTACGDSSKSFEESFEIHNTHNKFANSKTATTANPYSASDADDSYLPHLSIFSEPGVIKPLKMSPTDPNMPQGELPLHTQQEPQSYIPSNPSTFSLTQSQVEKVARENERIVQTGRNKILCEYAGKSLSPESIPGAMSSCHQQPKSMKELMWMHLEDMFNNGQKSPVSIQRWVRLCIEISDSSTPSPSPQFTNKQLSPDNLSFKVADLERASRCTDCHCKEMCCIKYCDIRRMLRLDLPELDPSYPLLQAYCQSLWKHNNNCDELACQIQYCDQVNNWSFSSESGGCRQMIEEIQKLLVEPIMSSDVDQSCEGEVKRLLDDLPKIDREEFETSFLAVSKLGEFGTDLLCCDMKTGLPYVQQTFPLFEESHQLAVYDRLRNLKHPHIVTQLYLVPCEESIKVYSIFLQGGSLLEFIKLRGALPWSLTVYYMKQILTAVIELHKLGVVYLYWHSGNMLFPDCSRQMIKLGSFGFSYPKNCKSDLGATKFCLPYNICPPELLRQNRIDFLSDSWGAGCLMAEMHTGKPVWYKERHENRERVHENIRQNFPKVNTETTNQKTAFEYCWQPQPERRKSIEELYNHLASPSCDSHGYS